MSVKSNIKWVGVNQVAKILIQAVGIVVLARIIEPKEYGIMSMALVVTVFASIFRDLGTSAAIIQMKDLDHKTTNTIFWLNTLMGTSIGIVIAIFSPLIAHLFHEQGLAMVLCLISLSFPITSISSAHLALLERDSKFNRVAFIEISSSTLGLISAIILACFGFGVYSLVAQALVTASVSSLLLWLGCTWLPTFKSFLNKEEFKKVLSFSGNLTSFNIINYFSRNADSMIIGHVFSPSILGAYSLAYRIMLFPLQSITFVASRSLFPVLSKKQDNVEEIKEIYLNTISVISLIVCPVMCGLAILREPFINLIVGSKWDLTSDLLLWLAPTGYIQSIVSTTGVIYMARNKTNILFVLGIVCAVLQVGSFILGAKIGVIYIAKFYFIANVLNFLICMTVVMSVLGGSIFNVIKVILPSVLASVLMSALIIFSRNYNTMINNHQLFILPFIGFCFYFAYMYLFHRDLIFFLRKDVP